MELYQQTGPSIGPPAFRNMRRSSSSMPLAPCVKRSVPGREIDHRCGGCAAKDLRLLSWEYPIKIENG